MKIKNQLAIEVQNCPVRILQTERGIYLCVTDIEQIPKNGHLTGSSFKNYLRNQNNVEFLALWELHNNTNFRIDDFESVKNLRQDSFGLIPSGLNWLRKPNIVGFISVSGRYGGTYAHQDITIHITAYFNTETYIHLTKELQRLKEAEQNLLNNSTKIPLEEIIAEANRMREEEKGKSEKIREEEE